MKRHFFSSLTSTQCVRYLAALMLIICLSLFTNPSQGGLSGPAFAATHIARPDTPIAIIKFDVGRLEQDLNAYGQWTEYDFRGQERYRFTEISSDDRLLRLQGAKGNVQLLVDFTAKTISGEWRGHPMAKLYSITRVEQMVIAQNLPSTPKTPTEPTTAEPASDKPTQSPFVNTPAPLLTTPPLRTPTAPVAEAPITEAPFMAGSAPMLTRPFNGKKSKYDPVKVTLAKFKGGSYIKKRDLDWIETDRSNSTFDLRKIGHNKSSIFLFDEARNIMIELDLKKKVARMSTGERLVRRHTLYEITEEDAPQTSVPEITPPSLPVGTEVEMGRLSVKDRFECRKDGGFVERAGMLGHERCTNRYSDGGNVCLDSRDCQGKCMTNTDAGKQNVSGKCQMTNNPFGCRSEVINGEAGFMLCVD